MLISALLQGDGLQEPMSCLFSNQTAAVNVSASVLNATAAMCTAPAWQVADSGGEALTLTVAAGSCSVDVPFEYYLEPQVTSVHPLQGPRYGSFQLTVNLGASLEELAAVDRVSHEV